MYLTITPAYGRDYNSQAQVIEAWDNNLDFIICDISSAWDQKPVNKLDLESSHLIEDLPKYTAVKIRYNKLTKIKVIKI